ncbi:MAG: ATP-binding protein [Euryarchaeota archaeon]|nr:ATP-binding protein [Euryarchaeota archaeon]
MKRRIEVVISEGVNKPYYLDGTAYKRVGSESPMVPPEELERIILNKKKRYFDAEICEEADLEDIDDETVRRFLRRVKYERNFNVDPETSVEEVLDRLDLLKNGKLTNAAILLFGKNPQKFFLQAEVRCARFKGTKPVKPFMDMKVFGGNIIDQVRKSLGFVLEHIPMEVYLAGKPEREERYEYPPDAIREAITNAICHRDYETSSNVQIRVFDNRIEVWGCGSLPEPLTPEDLKKDHRSILRNPLIAKSFFLLKYIEQWGTGTNDMINMCLDWGLPEPLFEYVTRDLVVTFGKSRLTDDFLEELELNERQKQAVGYVKENKEISNKIYREINNIGKVVAAKELNELVDKTVFKTVGKARATKYVLNDW